MSDLELGKPIIFDNGSGTAKCGFSGSKLPERVFKSIVGRPKHPGIMVGMDAKDCFVGKEAFKRRGILKLKYPIEHGMVCNWNDMEKIWHHTYYNELRVTPEEHPIFLTEAPLNPKNNREKMMAIQFETFNVPKYFSMDHSLLTLFSYGKVSGCVVESGDGVTHTCPIFNGYHSKKKKPSRWGSNGHAILRMNLAGRDVTWYLVKILTERGYEMTTSAERELVKIMKEKMCYLPIEFYETQTECEKDDLKFEKTYKLPDGSNMYVASELFRAPQIMFCPSFIGSSMPGLHENLYNSIQKCEPEQRSVMFENIVLGGGNTMFPGMKERLQTLVTEMAPRKQKVEVHAHENTKFSSFIGASVITKMSSFDKLWVKREDYEEEGATIVHRRCSPYEGGFSKFTESMLFPRKIDVDLKERVEYVLTTCLVEKSLEGVKTIKIRIGQKSFSILKCTL